VVLVRGVRTETDLSTKSQILFGRSYSFGNFRSMVSREVEGGKMSRKRGIWAIVIEVPGMFVKSLAKGQQKLRP